MRRAERHARQRSSRFPKVAISDHKFMVNGKTVTPQAYNVDGYNYFKLRDVAYLLSDTTAPFNVTWTPSQSSVINLISGQKYQKVGGELSASTLSSLKVSASTFKVLLNGSAVSFRGYLINDNNYYSIADIADAIGFEAGWDNATRTVRLTTPDPDPEQPDNNNSSNNNNSNNNGSTTPDTPMPAPTPEPVFTTGLYEVNVSSSHRAFRPGYHLSVRRPAVEGRQGRRRQPCQRLGASHGHLGGHEPLCQRGLSQASERL